MTGDGMKPNNTIDCPRCVMNYDRGFKDGRNELLKIIVKQEQCKTQVVMTAPAVNVVWPPDLPEDYGINYEQKSFGRGWNDRGEADKAAHAKAQTVDVGRLVDCIKQLLPEVRYAAECAGIEGGEESLQAVEMINEKIKTAEQALESAKGKI